MLMCIMCLTFGSYWVFDTPGAIKSQLQDWFGGPDKYTNSMNLMLYSVYSWPNTVLAFFGGFIVDRITVCIKLLLSFSAHSHHLFVRSD
jgi:hypothetical protein